MAVKEEQGDTERCAEGDTGEMVPDPLMQLKLVEVPLRVARDVNVGLGVEGNEKGAVALPPHTPPSSCGGLAVVCKEGGSQEALAEGDSPMVELALSIAEPESVPID